MLQQHPYRKDIMAEIHARPVVIIPKTCRLRRLVFTWASAGVSLPMVIARLQDWLSAKNLPAFNPDIRQHSVHIGDYEVTWELHTEFLTLTWAAPLGDPHAEPGTIGLELLGDLHMVCATRIDVIDDNVIPERLIPGFNPPSLVHALVEHGKAQFATDFIEDNLGFVRFEFAAKDLPDLRRSIIARRILEIESYSKMALLGLPMVRNAGAELTELEEATASLIRHLPTITDLASARGAMEQLNLLALSVAALSDRLSYRFAASQAYLSVIEHRLGSLHELSARNGSSISAFINNRVGPAVRTMIATEKRLDTTGRKIGRAVAMLNARNGLELEIQNSEILNTISQTAKSQFRLQKTVEGLSAIAISYYLLGIIGYALTGPLYALHWSKEWTLSIIAPIVFVGVFLASRSFWRKSGE